MTNGRASRLDLLFLTAGGIIWAIRFSVVYAVTAIACVAGWAETPLLGFPLIDWVVVSSAGLGIVANAAVIAAAWHRSRGELSTGEEFPLIDFGAAGVASLSILAIAWESLVIALPVCS
jgi:cytochrome c oxidase assembly factor CtaG